MIEINALTAVSEGRCVLDNVDVHIDKGSFTLVFTSDACSRHAFVHCLMDFNRDYSGRVRINSEMDRIRYIPDDILWEEKLTAGDYFQMNAEYCKHYDIRMQQLLCEKMGVHTDEQLLEMTFEGNKLVQIIAAVCSEPQLLILDMPQSFIGNSMKDKIYKLLKNMQAADTTVVVTGDSYEDVKTYCDYYIYLKEGKVYAEGNVPENDVRKRIITIKGRKSETLTKILGPYISTRNGRSSYIYEADIMRIPIILSKLHCEDYLIEEMTFEEEINSDYSRWE